MKYETLTDEERASQVTHTIRLKESEHWNLEVQIQGTSPGTNADQLKQRQGDLERELKALYALRDSVLTEKPKK